MNKLVDELESKSNQYGRPVITWQGESLDDLKQLLDLYYGSKSNAILVDTPKYYAIVGAPDAPLVLLLLDDKVDDIECHPLLPSKKSIYSFIEGFLEIAAKPEQLDTDGDCEPAIFVTSKPKLDSVFWGYRVNLLVRRAWNVYGKLL